MSDYYQLKRIEDKLDRSNHAATVIVFMLIFGVPGGAAMAFGILGWFLAFLFLAVAVVLPFVGLYKLGRWLEDNAAENRRIERERREYAEDMAEFRAALPPNGFPRFGLGQWDSYLPAQ